MHNINFSNAVEEALVEKVKEHNMTASIDNKASLQQLRAVYRRGVHTYLSSSNVDVTRHELAMMRINAFTRLLRTGAPANSIYKQDNDLLPAGHPKASSALTSGGAIAIEMSLELGTSSTYKSPEHALVAFAEYSGLGYEIIPSLRAAWKRGVDDGKNGFEEARELAVMTYDSKNSDLLPRIES